MTLGARPRHLWIWSIVHNLFATLNTIIRDGIVWLLLNRLVVGWTSTRRTPLHDSDSRENAVTCSPCVVLPVLSNCRLITILTETMHSKSDRLGPTLLSFSLLVEWYYDDNMAAELGSWYVYHRQISSLKFVVTVVVVADTKRVKNWAHAMSRNSKNIRIHFKFDISKWPSVSGQQSPYGALVR